MEDLKNQSLAELEASCRQQIEHWTQRRQEHLKQVEECEKQISEYDQKLRYIQALVGGPQAAAMAPPPAPVKRHGKRRRKSPIRDATLLVLRNRPGQRLTAKQVRTAIRKDTHKRCSRQAVNLNLNILEEDGLIQRARAPRGSGAQFVFWAV